MPSNKEKVASYLDIDETTALDEFCKENGYSRSQGVIRLIRNYLIEVDDAKHTIAAFGDYEGRIQDLEDEIKSSHQNNYRLVAKSEHLEEQIAILHCTIEKLNEKVYQQPPQCYTDDEIASVTGRRVQEVYEWRLGIRKPRGKNILSRLNSFVIVNGKWQLRDTCSSSESVVENVVDFSKT